MNHNIIVISGPSGSGKSTLINMLLKEHPEIIFSTSHTTRPIRENEVEGKDYYFVTDPQFRRMIDNEEFVEWAKVYQNYYGTTLKEVEEKSTIGNNLVLDIDVQGAKNIKEKFPDALFIFVVPPSMKALRKRLIGREKKITQNTKKRLEVANEELKQYQLYDFIVVNDKLESAFSVLNAIYIAFENTTIKHSEFLEGLTKK